MEFYLKDEEHGTKKKLGKKNIYRLEDPRFIDDVRTRLPIEGLDGGKYEVHEVVTKKATKKNEDEDKDKAKEPVPIPIINEDADNEEYERHGGFKLIVKKKSKKFFNFFLKGEILLSLRLHCRMVL